VLGVACLHETFEDMSHIQKEGWRRGVVGGGGGGGGGGMELAVRDGCACMCVRFAPPHRA
jgi:hypothetical protein